MRQGESIDRTFRQVTTNKYHRIRRFLTPSCIDENLDRTGFWLTTSRAVEVQDTFFSTINYTSICEEEVS